MDTDHLIGNMIPREMRQLQAGIPPSFQDGLQKQLLSATRGRVNLWSMSKGPAGRPERAEKPKVLCALCGGSHWSRDHPVDVAVTMPCKTCGLLHAKSYGPPSIRMTCDEAKEANVPRGARR